MRGYIKSIVIILCLFGTSMVYSVNGPDLNDVLDKYKYKNFFFQLEVGPQRYRYCKDYTYSVDKVAKGLNMQNIYFIYRGDEANVARHSFNFTCPVQIKGDLYYNLYANNNTKIIIDNCDKNYDNMKKNKLGKDLFGLQKDICLFIPLNMRINKLQVLQQKIEDITKVLPNKLGFDSIKKPIVISLVLFFLSLSILFRKKSF